MISYNTLKQSAAWKLYAKAQEIPFDIANEVSKQLKRYDEAVKYAEEDDRENISVYDYIGAEYRDIYEGSINYRGLISSWSIAPCSYLLYQGSIRREIGLVKINDHLCCAMDGKWAEENHFFKNDLLKVSVADLIYKVFSYIGMPPLSVDELLKTCDPKDKAWDVYKTGCTMSVNQVERASTSARAGKYRPTNVSELCAFVAAIRPGFKSMYKVFEERKPFSYGVKAFDDLIQTEEMPNSFLLYQEMAMKALNFAGIPMGDCYTAIKNIAKKRAEKVLTYKNTFLEGFTKELVENDGIEQHKAEETSAKLWQIIEDSSRYSFNASHSYCVSIDSLYCAWLKEHYPLEFYKAAIEIQDKKGDKDKMNILKEEAEGYFKVKFLPMRFGQDNRSITIDHDNFAIISPLSSIKGFGASVGKTIYECSQQGFTDFIDVLKWLDARSIKSAKTVPLIKIGYFSMFGNDATLLRIAEMFDTLKQGYAKTLVPDEIPDKYKTDDLFGMVGKTGAPLTRYQIKDMPKLLSLIEQDIINSDIPPLDFRVQAQNQIDILGYADITTGKEEDRKKLYVLDVYSLPDRFKGGIWKYKVKTKSIGSGKVADLSVSPFRFKEAPIHKGDILIEPQLIKDSKGYWNLLRYSQM